LLGFAEEHSVRERIAMRKQELMFAILKQLMASKDIDIIGEGVVEVLQDGFGFLRSPERIICPVPMTSMFSPSQIRRFGLTDRRHYRGRNSQPQGRRTVLRAAQGQHDQFRRSGYKPGTQDQFRQFDAALSG